MIGVVGNLAASFCVANLLRYISTK